MEASGGLTEREASRGAGGNSLRVEGSGWAALREIIAGESK